MDTSVSMAISLVVSILVQVVKGFGVDTKWGLAWAIGLSMVCTVFYGWSHGDLSRATSWSYMVAFASVLSSAAGIFGILSKSAETVTATANAAGAIAGAVKNVGTNIAQGFTNTLGGGK